MNLLCEHVNREHLSLCNTLPNGAGETLRMLLPENVTTSLPLPLFLWCVMSNRFGTLDAVSLPHCRSPLSRPMFGVYQVFSIRTYLGCYADKKSPRLLSGSSVKKDPAMTTNVSDVYFP